MKLGARHIYIIVCIVSIVCIVVTVNIKTDGGVGGEKKQTDQIHCLYNRSSGSLISATQKVRLIFSLENSQIQAKIVLGIKMIFYHSHPKRFSVGLLTPKSRATSKNNIS